MSLDYKNRVIEVDRLQLEIEKFRSQHRLNPKIFLQQVKDYFRIGLTYSSNALEGNTLTETETKIVLEDGLTIAGRPLRDHYEATGHSDAFDHLYSLAKRKTIQEKDILQLHKLFYYRIDSKSAGKYRKSPVVITATTYLPPAALKVPKLMQQFLFESKKKRKTLHPIEYAAYLHKELVNIHPFVDGNGRTARLLMNLALFQQGFTITSIPPILRADYINCIKYSQLNNIDRPFINFISCMVYESTKDYFRLLKHMLV